MPLATETVITPGYDQELAEHKRAELEKLFPGAGLYINQFLRFTGALVSEEFEPVEFRPERFAVIKASGGIAEHQDELEEFADTVAVLNIFGLPTTVVHGAGNQIDNKLLERGVVSAKNPDGTRITPIEDMWAVEEALQEVGDVLERALVERGAAIERPEGLFVVSLSNPEDLGSVDNVVHFGTDRVRQAARAGRTILTSCRGEMIMPGGAVRAVNANADITWTAANAALRPWKAISLTKERGIIDPATGEPISDLKSAEVIRRIDSGEITKGAVVKARGAVELAQEHKIDDVVILHSLDFKRELLTEEGAGTDIHA